MGNQSTHQKSESYDLKMDVTEKIKKENDFTPREYQVEILNRAIRHNTIVCLPTGSGKTFIATMLIKYLSKDIERKFSEGGKRTFFLVNTVTLVKQQAESISRHLPFEVGEYSGDKGVDYWDIQKWTRELDSHNILVMTAQIFLDLINHQFLSLYSVNLVIFDECHHSTRDHPMRKILQSFERFDDVERWPRIMGLTATLLNGNCKAVKETIIQELTNLEDTMYSQVISAKNKEMVLAYSTNPKEEIYLYSENYNSGGTFIDAIMVNMRKAIYRLKLTEDEIEQYLRPMNTVLLNDPRKNNQKKIFNFMNDIKIVYSDMGLFAADKATLLRIIQLEKEKLTTPERNKILLDNILTTQLHYMRHKIWKIMASEEPSDHPFIFASPKLKLLYDILKDINHDDLVLVFVEQRITAQVLFHIFKELQNHRYFRGIKPDFIVGYNNHKDSTEEQFERAKNHEILRKFNTKETNLLFASDVVEEGIDIKMCNYVIKFDEPKTYRSYIQSKGRARKRGSNYIFMAKSTNDPKKHFKTKLEQYKRIEGIILEILCDDEKAKWQQSEEEDGEIVPSYQVYKGGPCVTPTSAIPLINRYCSLLPQDKFTKLTPYWYKKEVSDGNPPQKKYVCILQLPVNSTVKDQMESGPFKNIINAKRAVAVKGCELLHKAGELDDNLLPRGNKTVLLDDISLYPHWDDKDSSKNGTVPGTKKHCRSHELSYSNWVYDCRPKPGVKLYIHALLIKPNYMAGEKHRDKVVHDILSSNQNFSILSAKKWPQICEFQLFLNIGEVTITPLVNAKEVTLTHNQINLVASFHNLMFLDAFPMVQSYLVSDLDNKENSYLIIPTKGSGNNIDIDWETIKVNQKFPDIIPLNKEDRIFTIDKENYYKQIIMPWYKGNQVNRYIVCDVLTDLNPMTPFPNNDYKSFTDYFHHKHKVEVMNMNQPLLEVRAISQKLNCLLPRGRAKKRKNEDWEEFLIPELCILTTFPAVYMLKFSLIPSILHRLHYLLLSEELRQRIVTDTGLGIIDIPKIEKLSPLMGIMNTEEADAKKMKYSKNEEKKDITPEKNETKINCYDIERELNFINESDIERYVKMMKNIEVSEKRQFLKCKGDHTSVQPIKVLNCHPSRNFGPQQCDLLEVLTSKSSNDVINYERLETLGDAFLKFAVSLALFLNFNEDEGKLTQIKGKIIGNRNLFYCGRNINAGGMLKVNPFSPEHCDIPCFHLHPTIKTILRDDNVSSTALSLLKCTREEQESGDINMEHLLKFLEEAVNLNEKSDNNTLRVLGMQIIPDKLVADVVEALIGAYLKYCGVEGGFRILKWLGVLPGKLSDINFLLHEPAPSALINYFAVIDDFLISPKQIEEALGYEFHDRSFLLQALSHPSSNHNLTDCYQRLEFLGDSILDFLITAHIYEKFNTLSPGEITDLRSALVNNVTFACLSVRNGFHKHLVLKAYSLHDLINTFVQHQEDRNHEVGSEVVYRVNDDESQVAELVDAPKILGDVFEALAGAVFLDSGKNFNTVWNVIYKIMEKEIRDFSRNVPKNPVRLMYETFAKDKPEFGPIKQLEDSRILIPLQIIHKKEQKIFHGLGENKALAKVAAAKIALKYYNTVWKN